MKSDQLLILTEKLITGFYNLGRVEDIVSLLACPVAEFSSCHSSRYALGKKAVSDLLRKEYDCVKPCKIVDIRFCEENINAKDTTVRSDLVLYMHDNLVPRDYHIFFKYDTVQPQIAIRGLRIVAASNEINACFSHFGHVCETVGDTHIAYDKNFEPNSIRQGHVIYAIGDKNDIHYHDKIFANILGYNRSLKLSAIDDLIAAEDIAAIRNEQKAQLRKNNTYQLRYKLKDRNNKPISVIESGYCMLKKENYFILNSIIIDISPLQKINEYFLTSLFYDDLTGIYNNETFYKKARILITENNDTVFEIMCVDVERFKIINEIFGKEAGNQLLRQIGRCLGDCLIKPLVYGRLYADKFALCYPSSKENRQQVMASLNKVAAAFKHNYKVILSFGVYVVSDKNIHISAMCDKANLALKKVKGHYLVACGEYDESMHQRLLDEQSFINGMNEALKNREFLFYLQPKYELAGGKIIGAEALVRWLHPQKGFIGPNRFIPIFEQNGFILNLDKYIWEEVCKLLRSWMDEGRQIQPISVNISRVDLYDNDLVGFFARLVKKYDVPPRLLELELTESAYIDNPEKIVEITQRLQEMGFIILMDDFGSGYSSLNMLKDVNVNVLKVDLKFLQNTNHNNRSGQILNSVVHMAKCLELPIIVEGVETLQQSEFLRSIGCNWVQGYYYSKPVPIETYEKLIEQMDGAKEVEESAEICHSQRRVQIEDFFNPNAKFNILFNSMTCCIGIYEFSKENLKLLRANASYFNVFRHDVEHFYATNKNIFEYVHRDDRANLRQTITKACRDGSVMDCSIRRYTAEGQLLHLLVHVNCIVKEDDCYIVYLALERIAHQNDICGEVQNVFNNMPVALGIFELCDGEVWVRQISKEFSKLTDYSPELFMKLTGGNMKNFLDKKNLAALKKAILSAYREKNTITLTEILTTRMHKRLIIKAAINVVKSNTGTLLCYMHVCGKFYKLRKSNYIS